jgi:hypothetical protein
LINPFNTIYSIFQFFVIGFQINPETINKSMTMIPGLQVTGHDESPCNKINPNKTYQEHPDVYWLVQDHDAIGS